MVGLIALNIGVDNTPKIDFYASSANVCYHV